MRSSTSASRTCPTKSGVPIGNWRSVGHSHNAFFAESFIDELAHARGGGPVEVPARSAGGMRPVTPPMLTLVAQKAGWGRPLPAGRARGLALHEASAPSSRPGDRGLAGRQAAARCIAWSARFDCGVVVHPQGVAQRVESSVVFGLSAALFGRIDIERRRRQAEEFSRLPAADAGANAPDRNPHGAQRRGAHRDGRAGAAAGRAGAGERAVRADRPPTARAAAGAVADLSVERRLMAMPTTFARSRSRCCVPNTARSRKRPQLHAIEHDHHRVGTKRRAVGRSLSSTWPIGGAGWVEASTTISPSLSCGRTSAHVRRICTCGRIGGRWMGAPMYAVTVRTHALAQPGNTSAVTLKHITSRSRDWPVMEPPRGRWSSRSPSCAGMAAC